jgi:DNA-binding cell septation regulator SpoVG
MKIERMKKGDWGNVRAFFDMRTEDGFLITGMKIVEGVHGMFVGFPSKAGEDGKYSEIVRAERELRDVVTKLGVDYYNTQTEDTFNDIPGAFDGEKKTEEVDKTTEDIPF